MMRKNLLAAFTVSAVVIGILTPTQSFSAPIASPGKTAGNGPCVTSGSTNSQTKSTKNTNKTCTYSIGEPGPGGGIIFYYDSVGFNCGVGFTSTGSPTNSLCHYLEVAPNLWGSAGDSPRVWAVPANTGSNVSSIADDYPSAYNNALGIGLGYKNSDLIVAQGNDATTAAGAARAYTSIVLTVTYSDWYLPTTAELNLLCQWNHGVTQLVTTRCAGGDINSGTGASSAPFEGGFYWSSSENDASHAWCQYFYGDPQNGNVKDNLLYVRPIRAF